MEKLNSFVTPKHNFQDLTKDILGLDPQRVSRGVRLCLIQTGNREDAYTLFEVLNDRSLMLNDLEIIKNKFYRKYYADNSSNENFDESLIETMDDKWFEVFNKSISQFSSEKISNFSISYICNNNSIKDGNRSLLDPISRKLNSFGQGQYTGDHLKHDFKQFELVKALLIEHIELPGKNVNLRLYEEFNKDNQYIKTCYFAHSLGQDRVLAGLVALYLGWIGNKPQGRFSEFALDDTIQKISLILWWTIFSSKDYTKPKELADVIFSESCKDPYDLREIETKVLRFKAENQSLLRGELEQQIVNWSYKKKADVIKIRLCFHKIFKYGIDAEGKIQNPGSNRNSANSYLNPNVTLDHLEPVRTNSAFSDYYYYGEADREHLIHTIGNLAPLNYRVNSDKSHIPLAHVIDYLTSTHDNSKTFYSHTIENLFNQHSETISNCSRPTQSFFYKRTELLQGYIMDIFDFEN